MFNPDQTPVHPKIQLRREVVFIFLSGLFLGSLAMLNILGVTRQIDLSFYLLDYKIPFIVFVGVLPYPITFLCTDFISELYGKKRATIVVWIGLFLNVWVLFILWVGGALPPQPLMQPDTGLPAIDDPNYVFFRVRYLTFSATLASMVAYLTAQFVDVHVFHFIRKQTRGRHLWIRNNGSTLTSQLVDSLAVVMITYYTGAIYIAPGEGIVEMLAILILSNYVFKMIAALIDTIPFYFGTRYLLNYLQMKPATHEYAVKGV